MEVGGLVVANPKQFGEREAGEDGIGGPGEDVFPAGGLVDPIDLGLGALVAPDEGGADDAIVFDEDGEAVLLIGRSSPPDSSTS